MYKVYRSKKIVDEIALCDADGNVQKTIEINFDVDARYKELNKAINQIIELEEKEKEARGTNDLKAFGEIAEAYGEAVIQLIRVAFGDENAEIIVDFYENRPTEIIINLLPYIRDVLLPEVQKSMKDKTEKLREQYKTKRFGFRH